jgi:uncharacterized GH25 family protein
MRAMKPIRTALLATAVLAAVCVPGTALAVRNWVTPSSTVLSGANAWITVDAATSDQLYFPNLRPLRIETIEILDSEGQPVAPVNGTTGKFRSTFDLQLTKPGTYKIAAVTHDVIASWTADGAVKRFRGTAQEFVKQVPADAADLRTVRNLGRYETFVTRDKPTTTVFKATGKGLEMAPITHPADVVVGEPARFRFLLDGKPAAGLDVEFARGGDLWKANPHDIKAKANVEGIVTVTLPEGGIWWMNAFHQTGETGRGSPPAGPRAPGAPPPPAQPLAGDGYSAGYTATVEVQLP